MTGEKNKRSKPAFSNQFDSEEGVGSMLVWLVFTLSVSLVWSIEKSCGPEDSCVPADSCQSYLADRSLLDTLSRSV